MFASNNNNPLKKRKFFSYEAYLKWYILQYRMFLNQNGNSWMANLQYARKQYTREMWLFTCKERADKTIEKQSKNSKMPK